MSDDIIERMKNLGTDVSAADVSSAGHVVMVDQPEAFIEAIRRFVGL